MNDTISPSPSCADPFDPETISVAEALAKMSAAVTAVSDFEILPIRECLGRTCFEAVTSPFNVPAHANSAMDGYALTFKDISPQGISEFSVVGNAYAGIEFNGDCGPQQCVRIMTGAVMPKGTDTVIMQEQVDVADNGSIRIDARHRSGENIRYAGEDISQGQTVVDCGETINPANLGVLASLGIGELKVYRSIVVAYFSTGDELVSIGESLEKGKIYDSNRYTLYGMLSKAGIDILDLGVVKDEPESIRQTLLEAADKADLIITTGGVSVGEADYIKSVLHDIGDMAFWKIAIKPGRPLTFGKINNCLFMGLPGNPVAVMVTFSQFVNPCLQLLSGTNLRPPVRLRAKSTDTFRKKPGRLEIQRGIAKRDENNEWQVAKTGKQGSGILTSMSKANCFIILDEN
ncbi:MAG: molybdopterin molybdotransferase MoeA, partial [Gammaproteobacteria bacterium]|nr:molybdopterin molybdotransferase MoeA [Gammaproteobacteria bacterium]